MQTRGVMELPNIETYVNDKREVGGLTFDFQGVRLDMKLTQKSMTKSSLNRLKFVVEYDDGTADVYERTLIW